MSVKFSTFFCDNAVEFWGNRFGASFSTCPLLPETMPAHQSPPDFAGLHRPDEKLSVLKFPNRPLHKA
jgi:hypothetical protein